jgi:hypothetical protein
LSGKDVFARKLRFLDHCENSVAGLTYITQLEPRDTSLPSPLNQVTSNADAGELSIRQSKRLKLSLHAERKIYRTFSDYSENIRPGCVDSSDADFELRACGGEPGLNRDRLTGCRPKRVGGG